MEVDVKKEPEVVKAKPEKFKIPKIPKTKRSSSSSSRSTRVRHSYLSKKKTISKELKTQN